MSFKRICSLLFLISIIISAFLGCDNDIETSYLQTNTDPVSGDTGSSEPEFMISTEDLKSDSLTEAFQPYSEIIENGDLDNLELWIFYIEDDWCFRYPVSVHRLMTIDVTHSIQVPGEQLKEHTDVLKEIYSYGLSPKKEPSYLDARLCYLFVYDGEIILEIGIGGIDTSVFINGIEVNYNIRFRTLIEAFVSENVMEDLDYIFSGECFGKP